MCVCYTLSSNLRGIFLYLRMFQSWSKYFRFANCIPLLMNKVLLPFPFHVVGSYSKLLHLRALRLHWLLKLDPMAALPVEVSVTCSWFMLCHCLFKVIMSVCSLFLSESFLLLLYDTLVLRIVSFEVLTHYLEQPGKRVSSRFMYFHHWTTFHVIFTSVRQ